MGSPHLHRESATREEVDERYEHLRQVNLNNARQWAELLTEADDKIYRLKQRIDALYREKRTESMTLITDLEYVIRQGDKYMSDLPYGSTRDRDRIARLMIQVRKVKKSLRKMANIPDPIAPSMDPDDI